MLHRRFLLINLSASSCLRFQGISRSSSSIAASPSICSTKAFSSTNSTKTEDDLDNSSSEPLDLSAVSTAAAISRTLRKYREAKGPSSANQWVDLEQLLSSKYLSRMDVDKKSSSSATLGGGDKNNNKSNSASSSSSSSSFTSSGPVLRPLQTAEEILSGSAVFKQAGLELKPQLVVRLNRPPVGANVLVDTDGLLPKDLVNTFTKTIKMKKDVSSVTFVRHYTNTNPQTRNFGQKLFQLAQLNPASYDLSDDVICTGGPSFNQQQQTEEEHHYDESLYVSSHYSSSNINHQSNDRNGNGKKQSISQVLRSLTSLGKNSSHTTVNDNNNVTSSSSSLSSSSSSTLMKNYMMVEKLAEQLHASHTVILHDVIYVCSDDNFGLYCNHIAKTTPFLDADVFVYSPKYSKKVSSKTMMPIVSPSVV